MHNTAVIVPHYTKFDDIVFLKTCINQILLYEHPEIITNIYIVDQSNDNIKNKINIYLNEINKSNVFLLNCEPIDAGYPIDYALENMPKCDYVCTIDADAFPTSNKYLYAPIKLIEKYNFSFVGSSTDLAYWGYLEKIRKFWDHEYLHINNYYRISKYETIKKVSDDVGFIRLSNRHKINKKFVETPFEKNIDWCDNGVIAQWYSSYIGQGEKLSLEIVTRSGLSNHGIYGMNIENMVYHVVFGYREIDVGTDEHFKKNCDEKFLKYYNIIKKNDIITDSEIKELLSISEKEKNGRKIKFRDPLSKEINDYINYLLN
jgi:hypothetical protein